LGKIPEPMSRNHSFDFINDVFSQRLILFPVKA
jgi:hypothetical protein